MKRITIFIITLLCLSIVSEASASIPKKKKKSTKNSCTIFKGKFSDDDLIKVRYGIVFGENVSSINNPEDKSSQNNIQGIKAGFATQIAWPKGFALQPELFYSQKGCLFMGSNSQYAVDYLELPVKAMYRLKIAYVIPFAYVAPYGAYAVRIKNTSEIKEFTKYKNDIKRWDCGISLGAGIDVWKVQLGFKYSWGFLQVIKQENPMKNRTFSVYVGILL